MKIQTGLTPTNIGQYFQRDEFAQIIKIEEGSFIATVNNYTLIDINAHTVTDPETNEESKLVWYVRIQVYPTFETIPKPSEPPVCTCPPTTETHNEKCVYYAPSPKQIYKQFLEGKL